jgi:low affinity Fe/Cu permease
MNPPIESALFQQKLDELITAAVEHRTKAVIAEVTQNAIEEVRRRMQGEASSIAMRVRSKLETNYSFANTGVTVVIQIQFGGDK